MQSLVLPCLVVNVADDHVFSILSDSQNGSDEEIMLLEADDWSSRSVAWKMDRLKSVNVKGQLFKLRVDEDDILADAVAFSKDPAFDPTRPLCVSFHGQPAIDTGGVLREFFSTVKEKFVNTEQFQHV